MRALAAERGLGAFLLRNVSEFERWRTEYLFAEGLIQVRGVPGFRSIKAPRYWREVRVLRALGKSFREHEVSMGSVISQYTRHLWMEFDDGGTWKITLYGDRVRTWDRDFFRYGVRDHQPSAALSIGTQIGRTIAAAQVERLRGALAAGATAPFGRVSATIDGVTWGEQFVPWDAVAEVRAQVVYARENRAYLGVSAPPPGAPAGPTSPVRYLILPAEEVYNLPTLELLRAIMHSPSPLRRGDPASSVVGRAVT